MKAQSLLDNTEVEVNLTKIQKSLALKAEEAKLLATLNLLKETKNLILIVPEPRNIVKNNYRNEVEILACEETQVSETTQQVLEEVNKVQTEILQKLQVIQEEIAQNIQEVESAPPLTTLPKPSATITLEVIKAESKVKIKKKALDRQKQAEKEAKNRVKTNPTKQNQKQVEEETKETQKIEKELQQAQEELLSLENKQDFEEALEKLEKELQETLQEKQPKELEKNNLNENTLEKKLEELVQKLQEKEVAEAASQKTMSRFMQEEAQREAFLLEQQQQLLKEANFSETEQARITENLNQLTTENTAQIFGYTNPFTNHISTSQKAEHFSELVQQQELKKAENLIKDSGKGSNAKKSLLSRLEKLAVPSSEEQTLLSHLQLTLEQYIAISLKTPYLTREEKDWLTNNYLSLTQLGKLQLINSGLNVLEINTYEKKEKLLKLTEEQQAQLEVIHPDQFKTFSLTGPQKNILNSLSPLIREDKYSEEALQLLKSLHLKPATQTFLVQEEIIPDQHTAFGTPKSSYLPLKEKFLKGEQKTLRKKKEIAEKKLNKEEIKQNKLSDILLTLGFKTIPKYNYFELLIFAIQNFETEPIKDNQEEQEQLNSQQIEEIITQILIILDTWRNNCSGKEKEAVKKAIKQLSNENLPKEQQFNRINLLLNSYPSDNNKLNNLPSHQREITQNLDLEDLAEKVRTPAIDASTSTSNKYDELLAGLEGEEKERERKRLEREESRRKLEESERSRREQKLSEKDRKLKEQEEKRQKEKELAEQEEKLREEAKTAREKALKEEQENFLKTQQKQLEDKIKKSEENFTNQRKEAELSELKKKADLEELERQNKFNQEQLEKNIKLLEEETQRKLEEIAYDDLKTRAEIEKKRKEDEVTLRKKVAEEEQDLLNQQRKAEDEFNKLKENNRLTLQRAQQDLETKKKKDEEELEKLKKLGAQESQEAQQEIKRLKEKQAEEARIAEQKIKEQAEIGKITAQERDKFSKLNRI
ncbi:14673_t:CDS:10 [Ambispora leptoticha]|uniref:14673_t:CDS:1 n=1 Tax=Ambispora leptoticha TaxID=144679 RepID=A0A9N8Z513_9GLOM|nr:14673_t:CDS:10 [Ambispora leptoticha]